MLGRFTIQFPAVPSDIITPGTRSFLRSLFVKGHTGSELKYPLSQCIARPDNTNPGAPSVIGQTREPTFDYCPFQRHLDEREAQISSVPSYRVEAAFAFNYYRGSPLLQEACPPNLHVAVGTEATLKCREQGVSAFVGERVG